MLRFSVDFGDAGRLKDGTGLRRVLAHNLRTQPDAEMKENVDTARAHFDRIWLNPTCGKTDGEVPSLDAWTAPSELSSSLWDDPASGVMNALKAGLGITRAKYRPGAPLLFGLGFGGKAKKRKKVKVSADASEEERKKAEEMAVEASRRALRSDAVLVQGFVVQAHPCYFFPGISEESWLPDMVKRSTFMQRMRASSAFRAWEAEHGPVDWSTVEWGSVPGIRWDRAEQLRQAVMEWALTEFGADRVLSVSLHMDESSPHVHVEVIPFAISDGAEKTPTLSAKKLIGKGEVDCRAMLDRMAPFFRPLGLERPMEGGPRTGRIYVDRAKDAEARAEKAEAKAQVAEARAEKAEAKAQVAEARAEKAVAKAKDAEACAEKVKVEIADRTARLDRREARLEEWTKAFVEQAKEVDEIQEDVERREANQQDVQAAGDEAVERLRAVMRQEPRIRPSEAVRSVAESYRAEAVQERRRADVAEQALEQAEEAAGPFAGLLRLPRRVACAAWDALADLLDEFVPDWLQSMRRRVQELQDEECRRQEAEILKATTTLAARLDGDSPMPG